MQDRESAIIRLAGYLECCTSLDGAARGELLGKFAAGHSFVVPVPISSLDANTSADAWVERAELIAKYGLKADDAEERAALVKQRREAIGKGFLDFGMEPRADELAADQSISVEAARAMLRAEKPEGPRVPTIEERAAEGGTFGSSFDFRPMGSNHKENFAAALDRAGARPARKETKK